MLANKGVAKNSSDRVTIIEGVETAGEDWHVFRRSRVYVGADKGCVVKPEEAERALFEYAVSGVADKDEIDGLYGEFQKTGKMVLRRYDGSTGAVSVVDLKKTKDGYHLFKDDAEAGRSDTDFRFKEMPAGDVMYLPVREMLTAPKVSPGEVELVSSYTGDYAAALRFVESMPYLSDEDRGMFEEERHTIYVGSKAEFDASPWCISDCNLPSVSFAVKQDRRLPDCGLLGDGTTYSDEYGL